MCLISILCKILKFICSCFFKCVYILCPPIRLLTDCVQSIHWMRYIGFLGGYSLGNLYYSYLLKQIPFPYEIGPILCIAISLITGFGNAICRQLRCISLLVFPTYCGKPGRGVLKAVVLTYVIAGPITNMGYNAKEVVRVYACSTSLSYDLSVKKQTLLARPIKKAVFDLKSQVFDIRHALRYFHDLSAPIDSEILDPRELNMSQGINNYIDDLFMSQRRSDVIEDKYENKPTDSERDFYQKMYLKKLEYRCNYQLSKAVQFCMDIFEGGFNSCRKQLPWYGAWALCWPMRITYICNFMYIMEGKGACDGRKVVNPGLGNGYFYLQRVKRDITKDFNEAKLQYKINGVKELVHVQDAKETGERVMHAFEEKHIIMERVIDIVNLCVALLFLRIIIAAGTYHDMYLTSTGHDNIYVTGYFKKIDKRRRKQQQVTLLPLKKMERSKYVDIHSLAYTAERNKIVTQILKVMLEMVTATTFVMLDRLFYEALDVVRQHAEADLGQCEDHDLDIVVDGTGLLSRVLRSVLADLGSKERLQYKVNNTPCLPQPRAMPTIYYIYIYGGYLWILLLLYINPYTLRLRRLICSWFYPRREKQRILHLYNDILKKRVKMQKTLHKKAVQAVRAYYLSGENLLSLRIKFPQILGWLKLFPAARMTCLICGETEPRIRGQNWHYCTSEYCPFVYCDECWRDIGQRCLACDPNLADLSDVDSLSEDEQLRY